jgi:hypothetical protein
MLVLIQAPHHRVACIGIRRSLFPRVATILRMARWSLVPGVFA